MKKIRLLKISALAALTFATSPLLAQSFHKQYYLGQPQYSRLYAMTKTPNNQLQMAGPQAPEFAGGLFPGFSVGGYEDWRILRSNLNGVPLSDFRLGTEFDDRPFGLCGSGQGNTMIVGHVGQGHTAQERIDMGIAPDVKDADVCFTVVNNAGVPIATKVYDFGGCDDHAYSIVRGDDNMMYFVGRSYRQVMGTNEIIFGQVDETGNLLTVKRINAPLNDCNFQPVKVLKTIDGGFVILASTDRYYSYYMNTPDPRRHPVYSSEIVLIKLNSALAIQGVKEIKFQAANNITLAPKDIVEDAQGNLVFLGTSGIGPWIMKLNNNGTLAGAKLMTPVQGAGTFLPESIIRNGSGFTMSGKTAALSGVIKIEVSSNLTILSAERLEYSGAIYAQEKVGSDIFLCGAFEDALLVRWPQTPVDCYVWNHTLSFQSEPAVMNDIVLEIRNSQGSERPIPTLDNQSSTVVTYCESAAPKRNMETETEFSIFPNPANTEFKISIAEEAGATMQVYDLKGQIQMEQRLQKGTQSIPVEDLESGLYLVRIISPNGIRTHRLAIAR